MSHFDATKAKLLIPGSSDYYGWRFTPSEHQSAWLALASLQQTLWDIVLHYREASVAQAKLVWWSEEIARTIAGEPQHPITQALLEALPHLAKTQGLLSEWIEGVMAAMLCQHLCTDADFSLMAKRSIAIPALLLCRYHDCQDEHTIKVISQQSEIQLFDRYLLHRQRLLSQGQVWIPLQRLSQAGLAPENIGEAVNAQTLKALWIHWLGDLSQPNMQPTLNANQQSLLKYPHTLTKIAARRCSMFLKRQEINWTTPVSDIAPLSKLWLAWRG